MQSLRKLRRIIFCVSLVLSINILRLQKNILRGVRVVRTRIFFVLISVK